MNPVPERVPHFNPGRLTDEEAVATFVARQPLFERLIADVAAEKPRSRAQHHLIVGQRGMGKTMLLTRLRAELNTKPELSPHFIPLVFAEEQYSVDRLSKFWLNCLDSLADALDHAGGQESQVDHIDGAVSQLNSRLAGAVKNDVPLAEEALAAFLEAVETTKRRPVLLVDNVQLVFERLDTAAQHTLREFLMRPGCPILVGTSPSPPAEGQDYGAVFYDHFKVHFLRPLELEEMRDVMLNLATRHQRDDVRQRILQNPGRLAVLRQLTGGNPRTTAILYSLYAENFSPSVYRDLEDLLDRVTALYKARFEELPQQQQVVASAVANHWDPVTSRKLTDLTGLAPNQVSPQLDRLEKSGFIERVELSGETSIGYQIAERFLNIWFLMRSASRRQRREVEFLTRFLQIFYEADQRRQLAHSLLDECDLSPDRYIFSLALADSVDDPQTAESVRRHAHLDALRQSACEARQRFVELVDLSQLPAATLAFDQLRRKLMWLAPVGADITPEAFAEEVLGDRDMFRTGERDRLASKGSSLTTAELQALRSSIAETRKRDAARYSEAAVTWVSHRLASGQIRSHDDLEDWNRAFCEVDDSKACQMMVDTLGSPVSGKLNEHALGSIRRHLQPPTEASAEMWLEWGVNLHFFLQCFSEAEVAYRTAIARDPKNVRTWFGLGSLLQNHLQRYSEAEAAYREAIARDPRDAVPWFCLGHLLEHHLHRYVEAEAAYREATTRDSKETLPWNALGNLLQDHLPRYAEAEAAYHEAIARDPKFAAPWFNLGNLLKDHLRRYAEAEDAYRQAIARDPKFAWAWNNLGSLLQVHLQRYAEAETAYREATIRDPKSAKPWTNLGNLFHLHLQRYAEAEAAYREAISCEPKDEAPWNDLGSLYTDFLNRPNDAAEAFAKCLEIDPDNEFAQQNLLFLHRDFLGEGAQAKPRLALIEARLSSECPEDIHLHRALFAAYDANWGIARESLAAALDLLKDGFPPATQDDWERAGAVLMHLNYGAEMLALLEERGDDMRLRPWYEALRALQLGDKRQLQNVAPEVRIVAEKLYDGIERRLKALPESTRRRPHVEAQRKRRSSK